MALRRTQSSFVDGPSKEGLIGTFVMEKPTHWAEKSVIRGTNIPIYWRYLFINPTKFRWFRNFADQTYLNWRLEEGIIFKIEDYPEDRGKIDHEACTIFLN